MSVQILPQMLKTSSLGPTHASTQRAFAQSSMDTNYELMTKNQVLRSRVVELVRPLADGATLPSHDRSIGRLFVVAAERSRNFYSTLHSGLMKLFGPLRHVLWDRMSRNWTSHGNTSRPCCTDGRRVRSKTSEPPLLYLPILPPLLYLPILPPRLYLPILPPLLYLPIPP